MINDTKEWDLGAFKITLPNNWAYQKQQGEDSFIGQFVGPQVSLHFDFSKMGYANSLLPTEEEYLKKKEWNQGYFYKPGVTYTADFNVKNAKIEEMKRRGITDSSLVNVEADPSYKTKQTIHKPTIDQHKKFPKADFIADLTYKDSTIYVPIEIPIAIKSHCIQIDTTDKFIIKTIWPKTPSKGITGIYFKGRNNHFTFNLLGSNLSKENQDLALQAFKTIKIK